MSRQQARPEVAARVLGEYLRLLRKEQGFALKDVAGPIRGSIAKVSRLERGVSPPKERDIEDLIRFFRVSDERAREIRALLRQAQESPWWKQFSDVTPEYLRRLIGLEGAAVGIYTYENHVVPGLLQTPEYARAVIRAALPNAQDEDVERRVTLRMTRQRLIHSPQRPRVVALLDEGILRRPVGGAAVMCAQLEHLREVALLENVHVRIVEFDKGACCAPSYPITRLHFGDGGPSQLVYVEHIESAHYVTRASEVEQYRVVLDKINQVAADRRRTRELVDEAIDGYRARGGGAG
ncbi:helix-turn-helix domain-containing protein [Streptomyces avicenniae]|uniref:helix-turn-helix domain-containing protein n=1 Tax=Streptomyces avicenniae TaxID=500153 RepID=UPI00069A42B2|nr:helix-turn-helix transcriptional regulator [Streptomyces avicenniae]